MPWTTPAFVFFVLPISVFCYYLIKILKKNIFLTLYLILVSSIFYSISGLKNILFVYVFITIVYLMGFTLSKYRNILKYKIIIFMSLLILLLCYYKFGTIIFQMFSNISFVSISFSNIVIPLGLSFIVFESISYLIDIYNEKYECGTYFDTLLFFLFFPKVVSGPIVLYKDFYPQIKQRNHSIDLCYEGIERIMIGFAKKAIIADQLGGVVTKILSLNMHGIDSMTALLGMVCYFVQIYYDFSGYSDIAIGISKLFGFNFKENFNFPYTATSVSSFWRKWHISLGTWFREYVYIPLGGNKKHVYLNLFIIFLLTGIWHGSTWNFIIWGSLHGVIVVMERYARDKKWYMSIPKCLKWAFTMIFIMFSWVIFMIPSLTQIKIYFLSLFGVSNGRVYLTYEYFLNSKTLLLIIVGLVGAVSYRLKYCNTIQRYSNKTWFILTKFIVYLILFVFSLLFMINSSYSPFLYFQF